MSDYTAFAEAFHEHFSRDPNERAILGIERDLGELPDPSLEYAGELVEEARGLLAQLEQLADSQQQLTPEQRIDLDIARLWLQREILRETCLSNGLTQRQLRPEATEIISNGIFSLLVTDPRPRGQRYQDVLSRIEKIPGFLDAMLARLSTPVKRWKEMELEGLRSLPELFANFRLWSQELPEAEGPQLERSIAAANAALERYASQLEELDTTEIFQVGEDLARELLRCDGIPYSLAQLKQIAADCLSGLGVQIEDLRQRLAQKYGLDAEISADDLQAFLDARFQIPHDSADPQPILDAYQQERKKIRAFCDETGLFEVFDEQDMKIIRTPSYLEPMIPAGAMSLPAAFREGTKVSVVYLTLNEAQSKEHTAISIPSMMIHEGIPGHHLQLATASLHPSLIRRHAWFSHHGEGWTTMLEDYMLDVGYVEDRADEVRFVAKRGFARLGARVAIDLFFMTGDKSFLEVGVDCDLSSSDPFVAAGHLLQAVTGFSDRRIHGELSWYSVERGVPLSYLVGNVMVWELKQKIQEAQAGILEGRELDKAFHKIYLESGNMPVSLLQRRFEQEGLLPSGA